MANKEKLLLQMIQNIATELKNRGKRAILNNEIGYEDIFSESDRLIAEYSKELNQILHILEKIGQLEKVVDQNSDLTSWEKLAELRERLVGLLENRNLYKEGIHTQRRVSEMFQDYYSEVDSLLSLYKRLNRLERQAKAESDQQMLENIKVQKAKISLLLGKLKTTTSDTLTDKYMNETGLIVNILKELDVLEAKAVNQNTDVSLQIEELKRIILRNVDNRLLTLMGYDSFRYDGPTVSEIFKEWKAGQIADYKVRYTQYKIMKKNLLSNASFKERSRLLEMDLKDAFLNYIDGDYALAELQFNTILEDYGEYFKNLESVIFYRAESFYGRRLYEEAVRDYERIVNEYPNSSYLGDSLFRLMIINEKLGNINDFYKYFDILKSDSNKVDRRCYNLCNYLAGYVKLKDSKFDEAEEALSNVVKDSKYYLNARFLLGIVFVNQQNYTNAIEIFKDLSYRDNYPWTDPQATFIRNNSLLKLGYIHYELGEYEEALKYFNSVSPGFSDYDKSLLGAAWTNFKQGNYVQTIENVNRLFQNYLASNYTYEALVLSAHSKKLLKKQDSALRDLQYVANAQRVLELSDQYNSERNSILNKLTELDQIEEKILERRDKELYKVSSQIRDHLQKMLLQFRHHGTTGSLVLESFEDERKAIIKQLEELDRIITQTDASGEKEIVNDAYKQRERLMKALDEYQVDKSIQNINYFLEYPLATKEGIVKYRKGILSNLIQQLEQERQRIQDNLKNLQILQSKNSDSVHDLDAKLELEILKEDLNILKNRSIQFRAWLAENQVQELNTDFARWADFSGYGISDMTFQNIKERDSKISKLSSNINSINQILEERRRTLEQTMGEFDEEVKRIEEELRNEQIEIERREKEKYFKELYFDTSKREDKEKEKPIAPKDSSLPN
ncbi:MAG: tetratricopeptide repeat protein [bacterium]